MFVNKCSLFHSVVSGLVFFLSNIIILCIQALNFIPTNRPIMNRVMFEVPFGYMSTQKNHINNTATITTTNTENDG